MSVSLRLLGLEDTARLGEVLAEALRPGDVVLLSGELGAGKTTLTKALVAGLDGSDAVTSPTFTLCHLYATSPPIAHVDCWRLDREEEIVELGLEELLDEGGVLVVEWGERAMALYGSDALLLTLRAVPERGESARAVALEAFGERWLAALEVLVDQLRGRGLAVETVADAAAR